MGPIAIDHVHLAMPAGGEDRARAFYAGVLGLSEVAKPGSLAEDGGAWFKSGDVELHLGVEIDFQPARRAHPALRVRGLDQLAAIVKASGSEVEWDDRYPGVRRCFVHDPFGNRIELMEAPAHPQPEPEETQADAERSEITRATRNRSMPQGQVIPELAYENVLGAADWLRRAFGFKVRLRIGEHRVQLDYGAGSVIVVKSVRQGADSSHAVMVRVDDVDAHYQAALTAGTFVSGAPTTYPFGERQYGARDIGGHSWTFTQTVEDVDPANWGGEPGDFAS